MLASFNLSMALDHDGDGLCLPGRAIKIEGVVDGERVAANRPLTGLSPDG